MSFFGLFGDEEQQQPASIWDHVGGGAATGAVGGAAFMGLGAIPGAIFGGLAGLASGLLGDEPAQGGYKLGDSYNQFGGLAPDDAGLRARLDHQVNDPLGIAEANQGKDIHQLLGMGEPVSMDESNRRFDRGTQRYDAAWKKYQQESNVYNNLDPDEKRSRQAKGDFGPMAPDRKSYNIG